MSKQKARQLFDSGDIVLAEVGTFKGLDFIHAYLFDEIYDFTGKLREVNIAKGSFRFAPLMYLEAAPKNIDVMPRSVVKDPEIKALPKDALTGRIDDRSLFMKGIDVSYYHEGYSQFKTEEL